MKILLGKWLSNSKKSLYSPFLWVHESFDRFHSKNQLIRVICLLFLFILLLIYFVSHSIQAANFNKIYWRFNNSSVVSVGNKYSWQMHLAYVITSSLFSGHGEQAAGGGEEHCRPHQWAAEDSGAEETGDSWTGRVSNNTLYSYWAGLCFSPQGRFKGDRSFESPYSMWCGYFGKLNFKWRKKKMLIWAFINFFSTYLPCCI